MKKKNCITSSIINKLMKKGRKKTIKIGTRRKIKHYNKSSTYKSNNKIVKYNKLRTNKSINQPSQHPSKTIKGHQNALYCTKVRGQMLGSTKCSLPTHYSVMKVLQPLSPPIVVLI